MKKIFKFLIICTLAFGFAACAGSTVEKEEVRPTMETFNLSAKVTVPVGTTIIYVEYNGANGEKKTVKIPVTPKMDRPIDGKNIEPFGWVDLNIASKVRTTADIYYKIGEKRIPLLDNAVIAEKAVTTKAANTNLLPEPKEFQTTDLGQTCYHSNGVVMFEDSWPNINRVSDDPYDSDFNDVIVDYDFEAVVVPDELLASEGWREQVKVVIHLRGISGTEAKRVGVILEGFDVENVESIDSYCSLDSWQNSHGELPSWTVGTLQENSLHYETKALRPCVEMGAIFRMNDANRGAGTETYTYTNNGVSEVHVFNPHLNDFWKAPKTEQYSPELATMKLTTSLKNIQGKRFYNVIPGYVNVAGGLYTYTVIYHMKPRVNMDAAKRASVLKNMLETVYVTTNQNFYIINGDYRPIHLKGYQPGDFKVKGYNSYLARYNQVFAENQDKLYTGTTFCNKDGMVWAFKCPMLTKHVWNKLYFSAGYPHYINWIMTDGREDKDWYEKDIDERFLSCEW